MSLKLKQNRSTIEGASLQVVSTALRAGKTEKQLNLPTAKRAAPAAKQTKAVERDVKDAPLVPNLSVSQCRRGEHIVPRERNGLIANRVVPVVDSEGTPLMPTTASRARRWIKSKKATPFWKFGIFCVRLNNEPSARNIQPVVEAIDPGEQKEGYTVMSASRTYLNIQCDAVTWVKDAIEVRRDIRQCRRGRNAPCRKPRFNRSRSRRIPPSIRARIEVKIRISKKLAKVFPISCIIVEDLKAKTKKGQRKWNRLFTPLEMGKREFCQLPTARGCGLVHYGC